jgi:Na+/H+ antiporter NhaD/arsenite permease-like protein
VQTVVVVLFVLVYVGMVLGRPPGLALDRTGVALLGAIALVAVGAISPSEAWSAIDVPTIALLFGLMIVSAQLSLSGFYAHVTERIASLDVAPHILLASIVAVAGCLSALLANDIVCLAMAPLLIAGCARRRLNPVPFLLALACAANVGSAATLIGNPQNMLIGQKLALSFDAYLLDAAVPAVLGLASVYFVVRASVRGNWQAKTEARAVVSVPYDPWQAAKALVAVGLLVLAFVLSDWPREILALGAAGVMLLSRRTDSRRLLAAVDGQLLVLFIGLFVVNHALSTTQALPNFLAGAASLGIDPSRPAWLFALCIPLSNLVSNVPAVMLLLPLAQGALAGSALALSSTLAGNLFLVGSIANLIVVDQAARLSVKITWRDHLRIGLPVSLITLALAAGWLALRARFAS